MTVGWLRRVRADRAWGGLWQDWLTSKEEPFPNQPEFKGGIPTGRKWGVWHTWCVTSAWCSLQTLMTIAVKGRGIPRHELRDPELGHPSAMGMWWWNSSSQYPAHDLEKQESDHFALPSLPSLYSSISLGPLFCSARGRIFVPLTALVLNYTQRLQHIFLTCLQCSWAVLTQPNPNHFIPHLARSYS